MRAGKINEGSKECKSYDERGATKPQERAFSELVGPMKHRSIRRSSFFFTLLDSYRGYSLVQIVTHKSEAGDVVMEMVCELENLLYENLRRLASINRNTVKWIGTDGGREYIGNKG